MTLALGLDLGSTTTKAVLVEVASTGEVTVRHTARGPSATEVHALLDTAADVVRACALRADAPIAAVGVAAMGESGAALDAADEPLTGILRWDAQRDPAHLRAVLEKRPDLPERSGIPATTKPAAVVLTALRTEQPDVFARLRHWAGAADLVVHALTGVRVTDRTLAARTMLSLDDGRTWDAALLADLGIPAHILPEPTGASRTTGAAVRFGLAPGIPVHVAGHDHAVGAWATGARTPGAVADSLGTAEAILRVTDAADVGAAVAAGFAVGRTVDGTAQTILGGSPACGALLSWWERERPEDQVLDRLANLPTGTWTPADTLVLPYLSGRQCPEPDPGAQLRIRAPSGATTNDRARGVLQALVFQARWMRESADALAGSPAQSLTVLGSLAERLPVWAPLAAAAGTPTRRCTAAEPVAAGAALLAAVRAGAVPPHAVVPGEPVPALHSDGLDAAYARFIAAARNGITQGET